MLKNSDQVREIALAVNIGIIHLERVVRGIREYAAARGNWRFLVSPETHHLSPASLEGWRGDGVIALANREEDFRALRSLECPVVNISGAVEHSPFPRVRPDYETIGRLAAGHLLGKGHRTFGFYGVSDAWYSLGYENGFTGELSEREIGCSVLRVPSTLSQESRWDIGQDQLERWLTSFAPPFAVMAAHDPRAAMVIRACERVGLSVPDEVSVIGVNDDSFACESCRPPLSSIERNDHEIGIRAARLLDELMSRGKRPASEIVVPPGRIVERASSEGNAVTDPDLRRAVEYFVAEFRRPIGVPEMVNANRRSRRWLEEAFVRELGCTPRDYLSRLRAEAVRRMLAERDGRGLGEIASACGYSGTRQMNRHLLERYGADAKTMAGDPSRYSADSPRT